MRSFLLHDFCWRDRRNTDWKNSMTTKPQESRFHSLDDAKNIYDFFISRVCFKKAKQVGQVLASWPTFHHREHFHFQEEFVMVSLKLTHQQSHAMLYYTKTSYKTK